MADTLSASEKVIYECTKAVRNDPKFKGEKIFVPYLWGKFLNENDIPESHASVIEGLVVIELVDHNLFEQLEIGHVWRVIFDLDVNMVTASLEDYGTGPKPEFRNSQG